MPVPHTAFSGREILTVRDAAVGHGHKVTFLMRDRGKVVACLKSVWNVHIAALKTA